MHTEDCTRGEDGREMAKRKTKKEDAGSTYGARGQEDQLWKAKERSKKSGRMVPSSLEPALGQSMQENLNAMRQPTCKQKIKETGSETTTDTVHESIASTPSPKKLTNSWFFTLHTKHTD